MRFYRLVKPIWAQPKKANGEPNPKFTKEVPGPNILEGANFSQEYLQQQNELGYSIFFFPNHPSENPYTEEVRFLNGRLIDKFNFVFADIDFKDGMYGSMEDVTSMLKDFPLTPTMTVSSGHGAHVYFRVKGLTREAYVSLQLRLIKHFISDPSVFTVLQLMRLPGFGNTKTFGENTPCEIVKTFSSNKEYEIQDLIEVLPDLTDEERMRGRKHLDRLDGKLSIDFTRDVDLNELPEKFVQLLIDDPRVEQLFGDPSAKGDRSGADWSLCHLLYSHDFNVKEALAVIAQTQKALEMGGNRFGYAELTVSKVFEGRKVHKIQSVSEFLSNKGEDFKEPKVQGPYWLDGGVLGNPWRKKEILGIIGSPGGGKTAVCLNIVLETIENNPSNDDVFLFVSLEMTRGQVIQRWVQMVGANSKLANRLFVVDYMGSDGKPLLIGLQEIYEMCLEVKQQTGKGLGVVAIDHLHLISTHINTKKGPDFGIRAEGGTGFGDTRNLTLNQLASQLKNLVTMLDTFLIVCTQTTKSKGKGDTPLFQDATYGISNFSWICDRIMTLWQPLMRCQSETPLHTLAWMYAKIREMSVEDRIALLEPKLLIYSVASGRLGGVSPEDYQEFLRWLPVANQMRQDVVKDKGLNYSVVEKRG